MGVDQLTATGSSAAHDFLEALSARDFERVRHTLAPAARARLLLPRGTDEVIGSHQIAARLDTWFGSASAFEIVGIDHDTIGKRHHAKWRFRLMRDRASWELIEQSAFIDLGAEGIERIDLMCSGFIAEGTSVNERLAPAR
jgi:hypothetical protein